MKTTLFLNKLIIFLLDIYLTASSNVYPKNN